ncbi:MAG: hypothetical protein JG779_1209, partial [Thermotoga sp.]|nr:hypothetical protein [Thermotoga sp.]
ILSFIKKLIKVRQQFLDFVLNGKFENLTTEDLVMYSYERNGQKIIVAANVGKEPKEITGGRVWNGKWSDEEKVVLKPLDFVLVVQE